MPRHIEKVTDNTSSSPGNVGKSAKDAHHLWLQALHNPLNYPYDLYPDEAKRLGLFVEAQPGTTGTIAQQPDVSTSRDNVPSSSRDTGTVHATVERERPLEKPLHTASVDRPPIAIDHTKTNEGRLFEIAKYFGTLSRNTNNAAPKAFYQKITRCLNLVLAEKGMSAPTPRTTWLDNTEPPSDPDKALSQAITLMRTELYGTHRTTRRQLKNHANEIENWMKE